jgi:uncharacterized surface protein with fasciclin (FAS1) repeats
MLRFSSFLSCLFSHRTDQYYTSFADVCKHRSERVSAFCDAVKTAGLGDALTPSKLDATVFVPNNAAFKKATEKGAPSKDALATILKYHVVPGKIALCFVLWHVPQDMHRTDTGHVQVCDCMV